MSTFGPPTVAELAAAFAERPRMPQQPTFDATCTTCGATYQASRRFHHGECPPCDATTATARQRAHRDDELARAIETIPPRFRWATFDSPELAKRVDGKAIAMVRAAFEASECVVLTGPTGAGKTSLAAALLRAIIERARPLDAPDDHVRLARRALFVSTGELAEAPSKFRGDFGEVCPALAEAQRASVLLLDDIGQSDAEGWKNNPVKTELWYRNAHMLPTIVTLGVDAKRIAGYYGGDAGLRRIAECGKRVDVALPQGRGAAR